MSAEERSSVDSLLQYTAENLGNDPSLELMWAIKAYEHAETYFNILLSVDTTILQLSPVDNEIYKQFRAEFPHFAVDVLDEANMKSAEQKMKWRLFCNKFDNWVDDWNMGTLLRIDSSKDISDSNTTLVPRIQFLAIEVARNREGCNAKLNHASSSFNQMSTDSNQNTPRRI